jgi:hypothetical protein
MRKGCFVLLLDGIDEMDLIGDERARRSHMDELWKLAEGENKLIFAGRPGYFATRAERKRALRLANNPATQVVGRRFCTELNLMPFSDDQIRDAFHAYFVEGEAKVLFEYVRKQPDLLELARRPALMHIIRETLDQARQTGGDAEATATLEIAQRPAELLENYTEHWIARDEDKTRALLVDADIRRRFSQELAVWMFTRDTSEATSQEIIALYRDRFPEDARARQSLVIKEGIESDLRTCSFLVPNPNDGFAFAHRPFFEYFLAMAIIGHAEKKIPLPAGVAERPWHREVCKHVADLLCVKAGVRVGSLFKHYPGPHKRLSELLPSALSQARKDLAVSTLRRGGINFTYILQVYASLLGVGKNRQTPLSGYLACMANLLQVDIYLGLPFAKIFRPMDVRSLTGGLFGGFLSTMFRSVFSPVIARLDLRGVDFSNCDLRLYNFSGNDMNGANFKATKLRGARFVDCNLLNADFRESDVHLANLTNAVTEGALFSHESTSTHTHTSNATHKTSEPSNTPEN